MNDGTGPTISSALGAPQATLRAAIWTATGRPADPATGGARLNPATDGRPGPRLDVRENAPIVGNLASDFNFNQSPRKPLLVPTNPHTDSPSIPPYFTRTRACARPIANSDYVK
jgi:hypothetical protein